MEKTLAFYLVIVSFLIPLFSVSASAEPSKIETDEIAIDSQAVTYSSVIVPTIELNNPGKIKVTISWTTPNLTFDKKTRSEADLTISYYGLRSDVEVPFHIVNESNIGTEVGFTGDIRVTASHTWAQEKEAHNINIRPGSEEQVFDLVLGGTNDSYKLVYSDNKAFIFNHKTLALTLTAAEIKEIMKVNVSFIIERKPLS